MSDEFPIVPEKTAMLFFDTLNGYMHPKDPERAKGVEESGILPRMERLNKACREASIAVFYGQADHREDGKDAFFALSGNDNGASSRIPRENHSGSWYADITPELAAQPGDYVIKKHRWSTFHQTHLELSLRRAGIDTIIICGGSTEVGVASTAYSARDRDFHQIVVSDACRSATPGVDEMFMTQIFPIFARVMTTDEVIAAIEAAKVTA